MWLSLKKKCFGKVFQSSVRHFVFVPSVSTRLLPSTVCQQEEDWKNSAGPVITSDNGRVLLLFSFSW